MTGPWSRWFAPALLSLATACGGGSGGSSPADTPPPPVVQPEPEEPAATGFTVSGQLSVLDEAILDTDTNNTDNPQRPNNDPASAQLLALPATVGGYLNLPATGEPGASLDAGDVEDVFAITGAGGFTATLFVTDHDNADLDLYLYNEAGEVVAFATDTRAVDRLTIPDSGQYYLAVSAFDGASLYNLTLGSDPSTSQRRTATTPVAEDVLLTYEAETILRPSVLAERRRTLEHRFALVERGGGPGRTRRMGKTASTRSALEWEQPPHLRRLRHHFGQNNVLLKTWETWMLAKRLGQTSGVSRAEPNFRVSARASTNDRFLGYLWNHDLISVPAAWDFTVGAPSVTVAVVDTGIIAEHPDLIGQLVPGYDFIADLEQAGDGDGLDDDPTDTGEGSNALRSGAFHGLHVSGTIGAAGNNGRGIAGIAYGSRIMPLRALGADGGGTTYDVIQAVRFAAGLTNDSGTLPSRPADVINLSLGGGGFSQSEADLYRRIGEQGVLVVAASGNEGLGNIDHPGAYDGVFAVGATDARGVAAPYSNGGAELDLVAPGGLLDSDINGDGQPDGILSTYYTEGAPEYVFLEGTSMAAAHVSGVFGLMRSINPDLDAADVTTLLHSGDLTDASGGSAWTSEYGWGLINAGKSAAAAIESIGQTPQLPPSLSVSSPQLNFGNVLTQVDIILSNAGRGQLIVDGVESSASWLTAQPTATDDDGLGTWTVAVNREGLSRASYRGSLTFASSAGPATLQVTLRVADSDTGDLGTVYVLLVDAESQEVVYQDVTRRDEGYRFRFEEVAEGRYEVWAGTDTDNDFLVCDEGEACGAWQTTDDPAVLEVTSDREGIEFSSNYRISLPNLAANSSGHTGADTPAPLSAARDQPLIRTGSNPL